MSRVEGSVVDRYHGAEVRRGVVSVVGWPWRAYQRRSRLWQNRPKGTVRSTALVTVCGLARCRGCLDVEDGDLDAPPGRVAGDDLFGGGGEVGGDQRDVIAMLAAAGRAAGVADATSGPMGAASRLDV
ncbi:MAG TPA: hypothetical protein VFQ77_22700 [Pseudonocardiaceae bacterium]|jgi:hypothetical protein|nr:hypothetical protein [Pseudonocardiaceae bacterium]